VSRLRRIGLRWRAATAGTVLPTALAFAATALVLGWIAVQALYVGRHAGTPRRTAFAILAILLAAIVVGVSLAVALRAVMRRRRLKEYLRPGELIAGMFAAELLDEGDDHGAPGGDRVRLTVTNQRLLLQRPHADEPWLDLEHEQVVSVSDLGPVLCTRIRRCLVQRFALSDGRALIIRMNASTALDFSALRGRYLEPTHRQMRALVVDADGPTPARPTQPLSAMIVAGKPTVCLLELGENYLRIIGEHSPPLADLYYHFHWEHMGVGETGPPVVPGLPPSWRSLRLVFHDTASLTLCGTEAAIRRLREHALSAGAATVA